MKYDKKRLARCAIFAGYDEKLAKLVAKRLSLELSKRELGFFSDGEIKVRIEDEVRGKDVFIIQSTDTPIGRKLFPILLLADAARRSFARSVNLVIPYFGYSRQDRVSEKGAPISAKVIADIIGSVGVNHVVTIDLHSAQTQGFFDMTIDNLDTTDLFAEYIKNHVSLNSLALVSPDAGGAKRVRNVANKINCRDIIVLDKNRSAKNKSQVMNVIGNPEGKNLVIIDDMIDTAGTIENAAIALRQKGGRKIFVMATHAILSGEALEKLSNPNIDEVVVTNSIENQNLPEKIKEIDISEMLAESIHDSII